VATSFVIVTTPKISDIIKQSLMKSLSNGKQNLFKKEKKKKNPRGL